MRTVLVVAHRTLVGDALLAEVTDLVGSGSCRFHLLVPVHHPSGHVWTDGEVEAAARKRLDEGLARFRELGAEVTGEVGDANPVEAVLGWLRRGNHADEIVLSTLHPRVSQWLKWDVLNRLQRQVRAPVTHVVYDEERVRV
jgi:hypothetical protein